DVTLPGSDAQAGRDLLHAHAPHADDTVGQVVLHVDKGRLDPQAVQETASRILALPHVTAVAQPDPAAGSLGPDGRTGYLSVSLDVPQRAADHPLAASVDDAPAPARAPGARGCRGGAR